MDGSWIITFVPYDLKQIMPSWTPICGISKRIAGQHPWGYFARRARNIGLQNTRYLWPNTCDIFLKNAALCAHCTTTLPLSQLHVLIVVDTMAHLEYDLPADVKMTEESTTTQDIVQRLMALPADADDMAAVDEIYLQSLIPTAAGMNVMRHAGSHAQQLMRRKSQVHLPLRLPQVLPEQILLVF